MGLMDWGQTKDSYSVLISKNLRSRFMLELMLLLCQF